MQCINIHYASLSVFTLLHSKEIQLKDFLLHSTMQHNIFELIVVTRKRDKNFLINTHTHNGVQKTLPDKSSLCLSLACSRTSFHFLSLRLMKKYYLALPLQLCCSPCLILSILFFISRQLNSALFL